VESPGRPSAGLPATSAGR